MTDTTMYDTPEGAEGYAKMAKGYDGRTHIERLNQPGSEMSSIFASLF